PRGEPEQERDDDGDDGDARRRVVGDEDQRRRRPAHRAAEELRRGRAERMPTGEREALRAPGLACPGQRQRPLILGARAGRGVVEPAPPLAPAPLIAEPWELRDRPRTAFRDDVHLRPELAPRLARVVAADALRGAATEEERRRKVV